MVRQHGRAYRALQLVLCTTTLATGRPITEYVGMAPAGGDGTTPPLSPSTIVKWARLSYDSTATAAEDVTLELLNSTVPELGAWFDLDLAVGGGGGAALTAKVLGTRLYAYVDKNQSFSAGGGCCADTLRIYDHGGGAPKEWDLDAVLYSQGETARGFRGLT
jgi:hypothetical protein